MNSPAASYGGFNPISHENLCNLRNLWIKFDSWNKTLIRVSDTPPVGRQKSPIGTDNSALLLILFGLFILTAVTTALGIARHPEAYG